MGGGGIIGGGVTSGRWALSGAEGTALEAEGRTGAGPGAGVAVRGESRASSLRADGLSGEAQHHLQAVDLLTIRIDGCGEPQPGLRVFGIDLDSLFEKLTSLRFVSGPESGDTLLGELIHGYIYQNLRKNVGLLRGKLGCFCCFCGTPYRKNNKNTPIYP